MEPLAAIAAVFAVAVGLSVYVVGLGGVIDHDGRPAAETVLDEVRDDASTMGIVEPAHLSSANAPAGWQVNVTLVTRDGRVTAGPTPPAEASVARERVPVRLGPGEVGPGHLIVEAWR